MEHAFGLVPGKGENAMNAAIRNLYIGSILALVLACSITAWAYGHRYDTGLLSEIRLSSNEVVVSGKVYRVRPDAKVILKEKEKGAYYEHVGRLSDLRQGEKVYLKVFGPNDVLEIEVMR